MTNQDAFNKAVVGLASQKFEKSTLPLQNSVCTYRGVEGRKCALGWLIDDSCYVPTMESVPLFQLIEDGVVNCKDLALASELRYAHDSSRNPEDMKSRLVVLTIRFRLDIPKELLT